MKERHSRNLPSRSWLRPFKNASILAIGRGAQGVLSLLYVVLATRVLGPEQFGLLTMIHGVVLVAAQIVRFQSWQAVMRFGAQALAANDHFRLWRVLNFALLLDIVSALAAAGALWVAMAEFAEFFQLPDVLVETARWYGLSVGCIVLGATPLGVLRLFDCHAIVAWQTTVEPLVRLVTTALCFALNAELEYFLIGWFAASLLSKGALFAGGLYVLFSNGVNPEGRLFGPDWWKPEDGIWRFSFGTYLSSTLNISDVQIGPLLVGSFWGPAAAGLYRVAQQVGNVVSKPVSKLLAPAIYTDFSQLSVVRDRRARLELILRAGGLAGILALGLFAVLALSGRAIISLVFGDAYLEAYSVMLWLAWSGVIAAAIFPLAPLLITSGRVYAVVLVRSLGLGCYLAMFYSLAPTYGLTSGGMAVVAHGVAMAVFLAVAVAVFAHRTSLDESGDPPH